MTMTAPPSFGYIISIALLWLSLMWGVRFTVSASSTLVPLGQAAYRIVRHGMTPRQATKEWTRAFDEIFMALNIALFKPWAMVLLLGGMVLMGAGYGLGASGDVAILVTPGQTFWLARIDRYLDWLAATAGCIGMAAGLAGISPRPGASILVSLGFTLAGIGIGIASAYF